MLHAIATGLRGFQSDTLRVRITRQDQHNVWVITADLLDAGTKLVIDPSQVTPEQPMTVTLHCDGLVAFA